jgi:hypothetical protein
MKSGKRPAREDKERPPVLQPAAFCWIRRKSINSECGFKIRSWALDQGVSLILARRKALEAVGTVPGARKVR